MFGKNHQQSCLVSPNEIEKAGCFLKIIKIFLDISSGLFNKISRLFIVSSILSSLFFENSAKVWYMFLLGQFSSSKTSKIL